MRHATRLVVMRLLIALGAWFAISVPIGMLAGRVLRHSGRPTSIADEADAYLRHHGTHVRRRRRMASMAVAVALLAGLVLGDEAVKYFPDAQLAATRGFQRLTQGSGPPATQPPAASTTGAVQGRRRANQPIESAGPAPGATTGRGTDKPGPLQNEDLGEPRSGTDADERAGMTAATTTTTEPSPAPTTSTTTSTTTATEPSPAPTTSTTTTTTPERPGPGGDTTTTTTTTTSTTSTTTTPPAAEDQDGG